jgi:uncharacterized membrane protein YcjF (UPF0283 family)
VRFPFFESFVSELLQRWRLRPKLSRHHQSRKFCFSSLFIIASLALLCSLSLVFVFSRVMRVAWENHGAFLYFSASVAVFFFFFSFSSVYVEFLTFVLLEMGDFRKRQRQRYSFLGLCL